MKKLFLVMVFAVVVAAGCAHRQAVQNAPQAGQGSAAQKPVQEGQKGNQAATAPSKDLSDGKVSKKDSDRTETSGESAIKIQDIHFDFDKYTIRENEKAVLKKAADILLKHKGMKVAIEGNCDEKGTVEYNMALGDRRAGEAKSYLVSLGVSAARIETVSYGKEKPACHESNEKCWASNRRDHFVFSD